MEKVIPQPAPNWMTEEEREVWQALSSFYLDHDVDFPHFASVLQGWIGAAEHPNWPSENFYEKNAA